MGKLEIIWNSNKEVYTNYKTYACFMHIHVIKCLLFHCLIRSFLYYLIPVLIVLASDVSSFPRSMWLSLFSFWVTRAVLSSYSSLLTQGSLLVGLRKLYVMLRIKPSLLHARQAPYPLYIHFHPSGYFCLYPVTLNSSLHNIITSKISTNI